MATLKFAIVQGNTAPNIQLTLERDMGPGANPRYVPINLTAAAVALIIKDNGLGTVTNTGHQTCTLVDAVNGVVSYAPQSGDFANTGTYYGDAQITYSGGGVEIMHEQLVVVARQKLA